MNQPTSFFDFAAENARNMAPKKCWAQVVRWDDEQIIRSILCNDQYEARWIQLEWSNMFDRRFYDIRIVEAL